MKAFLLAGVCYFSCCSSFGQTSSETIENWQRKHPQITFIAQENFDGLSKEQKQLLGENYIIYNGDLSSAQIDVQVKSMKSNLGNIPFSYDDPNAQEIKNWLGENSHVRVIKGEIYDEKNLVLNDRNTLIYYGEFLTLEDIRNYEK